MKKDCLQGKQEEREVSSGRGRKHKGQQAGGSGKGQERQPAGVASEEKPEEQKQEEQQEAGQKCSDLSEALRILFHAFLFFLRTCTGGRAPEREAQSIAQAPLPTGIDVRRTCAGRKPRRGPPREPEDGVKPVCPLRAQVAPGEPQKSPEKVPRKC